MDPSHQMQPIIDDPPNVKVWRLDLLVRRKIQIIIDKSKRGKSQKDKKQINELGLPQSLQIAILTDTHILEDIEWDHLQLPGQMKHKCRECRPSGKWIFSCSLFNKITPYLLDHVVKTVGYHKWKNLDKTSKDYWRKIAEEKLAISKENEKNKDCKCPGFYKY